MRWPPPTPQPREKDEKSDASDRKGSVEERAAHRGSAEDAGATVVGVVVVVGHAVSNNTSFFKANSSIASATSSATGGGEVAFCFSQVHHDFSGDIPPSGPRSGNLRANRSARVSKELQRA